MRLKSFHARTMSEAMRQVREALGDDAIIVATREEEDGGVRVTAAVEEQEPAWAERPPPSQARDGGDREAAEAVADALYRTGCPAQLADRIVAAVERSRALQPRAALAEALGTLFRFDPLPKGPHKQPLMLVGPPGAGKTLTMAKLATRAVMANLKPLIISTDVVRAGGVEQLAGFTKLLKLDLLTVEDPATLEEALRTLSRGAQLILIDSAGRNPFSAPDMTELARLLKAAQAEPVLVLPAGLDPAEAVDLVEIFQATGVKRLVSTRLDAARRLGSLLAAADRGRLAFADASETPRVPQGLLPLDAATLARFLMPDQRTPWVEQDPAPPQTRDRR